ncbi:cobW-domain-containing protein [Massarina eburnea CBS 473.64]|uniref:CobW-domain-containing protein n=1 Tax=Massarina eburnea CBS 473.64 TaxID=1395130 RepID=A0A6A6RTC0_9PLEO|nr:cobW-domain-containing protein [Massarina eburnea CBS 473.64]
MDGDSSDDDIPSLVPETKPRVVPGDDDEAPELLATSNEAPRGKVPITIVTGYLGAGKTTLLNYILTEQHGKKIAVILNEFGDSIDIEKQLTISDENSTEAKPAPFVPLANGCICCSVKDIGVAAIENLMEHQGNFDYILLETTGLADPGNIAPLFWLDDGLGSSIFLDGIVTLVDAKNVLKSLDEGFGDEAEKLEERKHEDGHSHEGPLLTTAHLQISHADVVLVNKTDLVSEAELQTVVDRIRSINGLAKIKTTTKSQVPQLEGLVLDLHAYDEVTDADLKFASKGHSHLDPTISTSTINFPAITKNQLDKFDEFLRTILWEDELPNSVPHEKFEIHRLKGRVPIVDGEVLLVQGVRNVYDTTEAKRKPSVDEQDTEAKLVLIGKGVDQPGFHKSLIATLAGS